MMFRSQDIEVKNTTWPITVNYKSHSNMCQKKELKRENFQEDQRTLPRLQYRSLEPKINTQCEDVWTKRHICKRMSLNLTKLITWYKYRVKAIQKSLISNHNMVFKTPLPSKLLRSVFYYQCKQRQYRNM